jgi:2'-phosphotransferase
MEEIEIEETEGLKVIHGSYFKFWEPIKESGLNKMRRNHIHFTTKFIEDKPISGMRNTCDLIIELDINKAIKDGIKFYRSKN